MEEYNRLCNSMEVEIEDLLRSSQPKQSSRGKSSFRKNGRENGHFLNVVCKTNYYGKETSIDRIEQMKKEIKELLFENG